MITLFLLILYESYTNWNKLRIQPNPRSPLTELRTDSEIIGNVRISKIFHDSFVHHRK